MPRRGNYRVRGRREFAVFVGVFFVTVFCTGLLALVMFVKPGAQDLGVTFSSKYSRSLGLSPVDVFTAIVNDLGVQRVRIPVYWDDVEVAPRQWDFSDVDALMAIAEQGNVEVTLVVGMKVPRWPECFVPTFFDQSLVAFDEELLLHVQRTVEQYRHHPALARWQVENEVLFPYGECPPPSLERVQEEIALVRDLDANHPVMLTVSGEQESWLDVASIADTIGVSMYRFAYNDVLGPLVFPHPPLYYRFHAMIAQFFSHDVIISELQMEPWFTGSPQDPSSIAVPFDAADFREHIVFARNTGIREVLLWGVEWWYYTNVHGDPSLWNVARDAFRQ